MRDFEFAGRSAAMGMAAMAATPHPLATATALDLLRTGANAMDAAIAANAVLGVVEPAMTGIGGDCVVLYAPRGRDPIAFVGIGAAPGGARLEWFRERGIRKVPAFSPHLVAIPGLVDGWDRLARDHGTRSLTDLLAPAIGYAEEGFPVTERVAADAVSWAAALRGHEGTRAELLGEGPLKVGARRHRPRLAHTLRRIAAERRDGFYRGPVAEEIVALLRSLGGLHTMDDFEGFAGSYALPISIRYRDYEVRVCPPPSLGSVALEILAVLSRFDLSDVAPLSPRRLHLTIEAARLAYADRRRFLPGGDHGATAAALLDPERIVRLADRIRPDFAIEDAAAPAAAGAAETTYLCVVDRDRNAVSFMSTLVEFFGSGLTAPESGVLLNSRGEYFTDDEEDANAWAPGRRPLSFSLPALVMRDGCVEIACGIVGGVFQPMGLALILSNMLDFGLDVQIALTLPRVFSSEGMVDVERGIPDATALDLAALGHKVVRRSEGPRRQSGPLGGGQAIAIDWHEGVLWGGADPRKDGVALGF